MKFGSEHPIDVLTSLRLVCRSWHDFIHVPAMNINFPCDSDPNIIFKAAQQTSSLTLEGLPPSLLPLVASEMAMNASVKSLVIHLSAHADETPGWDQLMIAFASALEKNHSLNFLRLVPFFAAMPHCDALLRAIENHANINVLDIGEFALSVDNVELLSRHKSLTELGIMHMTKADIPYVSEILQRNAVLNRIHISAFRKRFSYLPLVGAIAQSKSLSSLKIYSNHAHNDGLALIAAGLSLPSVTRLSFSGDFDDAYPAFVAGIAISNSLRFLKLEKVFFSHPEAVAFVSSLSKNQSLKTLKLLQCAMEVAEVFGDFIRSTKTVSALSFGLELTASADWISILEAIGLNSSIKKLVFSETIDDAHADLAGLVFRDNKVLETLVCYADLGRRSHFVSFPAFNTSLVSLELTLNALPADFVVLFRAIGGNCVLRNFSLVAEGLDEEAVSAYGNMLVVNRALQRIELDLHESKFWHATGVAIASALHKNRCLTDVDVSGFVLTSAAARSFAEALVGNESVTRVRLLLPQEGASSFYAQIFHGGSCLIEFLGTHHTEFPVIKEAYKVVCSVTSCPCCLSGSKISSVAKDSCYF